MQRNTANIDDSRERRERSRGFRGRYGQQPGEVPDHAISRTDVPNLYDVDDIADGEGYKVAENRKWMDEFVQHCDLNFLLWTLGFSNWATWPTNGQQCFISVEQSAWDAMVIRCVHAWVLHLER